MDFNLEDISPIETYTSTSPNNGYNTSWLIMGNPILLFPGSIIQVYFICCVLCFLFIDHGCLFFFFFAKFDHGWFINEYKHIEVSYILFLFSYKGFFLFDNGNIFASISSLLFLIGSIVHVARHERLKRHRMCFDLESWYQWEVV